MKIDEMRGYIAQAYSGESWHDKVRRMPDSQVFAIYKRLEQRERQRQYDDAPSDDGERVEQMTIDMFM